jgi:hypothetical protein
LVKHAVAPDIENVYEFSRGLQAEKIVNLTTTFVEEKFDVGFVQHTFLSEISFPYGLPHLLALPGSSE